MDKYYCVLNDYVVEQVGHKYVSFVKDSASLFTKKMGYAIRNSDLVIEYANNTETQEWRKNDQRHRLDGPAIIWADGKPILLKNRHPHNFKLEPDYFTFIKLSSIDIDELG